MNTEERARLERFQEAEAWKAREARLMGVAWIRNPIQRLRYIRKHKTY